MVAGKLKVGAGNLCVELSGAAADLHFSSITVERHAPGFWGTALQTVLSAFSVFYMSQEACSEPTM